MPDQGNEELAAGLQSISTQLESIAERTNRLEALAQQIELNIRLMSLPLTLNLLSDVFENAKQLRAYELSDGVLSTRSIGDIVGVDQKTISNWWQSWEKKPAIVEKVGKRGQYRKRYSIYDLVVNFQPEVNIDPNNKVDDDRSAA